MGAALALILYGAALAGLWRGRLQRREFGDGCYINNSCQRLVNKPLRPIYYGFNGVWGVLDRGRILGSLSLAPVLEDLPCCTNSNPALRPI